MAKPNEEIKQDEEQTELSDIEIAELANKEIKERDKEIAKLKKDLAKAKLLSEAEEEETEALSREECLKRISDSGTTNYDYAEAVVGLVDAELADGKPNPLGVNGDAVYEFFKDVLEECEGDKTMFTSIYQSRLAPDDKSVAMAYKKRK